MGKTIKIHRFDPELYPFKLWVTITNNGEVLADRFLDLDRKGKSEITSEDLVNAEAITYYAQERETGMKGMLVSFTDKRYMSVKNIAHEATHVARKAWDHMGESQTGEEADAYLVGWIAKCMEEVRVFKKDRTEPTDKDLHYG
jgi:hypothetical protein